MADGKRSREGRIVVDISQNMESSRQLGTSNSFRQRVNVTMAFLKATLTNNKGSGNAWHKTSYAGRRV